ncbi:MAG: hypothetical protein ACP5UN_03930, partial [Candidatus Micrarchaeia archaeon]
ANMPDFLFSLGIMGIVVLPPLIYEGFSEFCYDTSWIKKGSQRCKEKAARTVVQEKRERRLT